MENQSSETNNAPLFGEVNRIVVSRDQITQLKELGKKLANKGNIPVTAPNEKKQEIEAAIQLLEDLGNIVLPRDMKVAYISENKVRKLIEYTRNESWYLFFSSTFLG